MEGFAALLIALGPIAAAPPTASVEIDLTALRNSRGVIQACLTRNPSYFPDCRSDPDALTRSVPASVRRLEFQSVPAGRYALSVFHDENGNRKLDTLVGIPK
jgi:uncharacterized protein (DUF2141 family)